MIDVKIVGNLDIPEYKAAQALKQIIERDMKPRERGSVLIVVGATCFGQEVKDVDLVVFGRLSGFARELWTKAKRGNIELEQAHRFINVSNFCFCIEVKDHSPESVEFQASTARVKYKNKDTWHNASNQSDRQKYSLKAYLDQAIGWSPYICNFIWFRNIPWDSLPKVPHNWLPSNLNLDLILQLACEQHWPKYNPANDAFYFSSARSQQSDKAVSEFERAFSFFERTQRDLGKLTRDRLEKITRKLLREQQYALASTFR